MTAYMSEFHCEGNFVDYGVDGANIIKMFLLCFRVSVTYTLESAFIIARYCDLPMVYSV